MAHGGRTSASHRRTRLTLLCLSLAIASALAVALVAAAPALADDTTPPQVTTLSLTPSQVDTDTTDQAVTLTVTISDAQSGVSAASYELESTGSTQTLVGTLGFVSGDMYDGIYSATVTMPEGSQTGVWSLYLRLTDNVNNSATLSPSELDAQFGAGSAEVTNTATLADSTPPALDAFAATPAQVDTGSSAQTITVNATLSDAQSGVTTAGVQLREEGGTQVVSCALSLVSGDVHNGDYTGTLRLPCGSAAGTWDVYVDSADALGNSQWWAPIQLDQQFGAGSGEVTDTASVSDTSAPQVTAFSITPTEVDTESATQMLTVTATLTDDLSGVSQATVWLEPLIGTQWAEGLPLQRTSGTDLSGIYTGTIYMQPGAKEGMWTAYLDLIDNVGNQVTLDADQINALVPGATGLLIANTATAQQVTIDRQWTLTGPSSAVTFPAGTVVTRQGGGSFAFYQMTAVPFTLDSSVPTTGLDGTPLATLEFGIPGLDLSFDRPVTVSMDVGDAYDGYQLTVQSLPEGGSAWANETTCDVTEGWVNFTVDHATHFVVNLTKTSPPKPTVAKLSATSGRRGGFVTITGKWFGAKRGTSTVKFGLRACIKYVSWSMTRIRCRVPTSAACGRLRVIVRTPSGTSNLKYFTVKR